MNKIHEREIEIKIGKDYLFLLKSQERDLTLSLFILLETINKKHDYK